MSGISYANEPSWTPEQRAKNRDVVVDATVTKIQKVHVQPNEEVDLMRAVLEVTAVHKGGDILGTSKTIEILFETSPLGAKVRCPAFPALKSKQRGRFYLHFKTGLSEQQAFILEMGSDLGPILLNPHKVIPELTKALKSTPTFDHLTQILGQPDKDIGSGIYIYVYTLEDGATVTVGTADKKAILYVNLGGKRLCQWKAKEDGTH